MGFREASDRLADDAVKIERMTGLDQARRPRPGLAAWLTGPASEGFQDFGSIASLPALIAVVQAATDAEFEASRDLARILLDGISVMSRLSDALTLTDNAIGLAAWEAVADDPSAAVWFTAFVSSVRSSAPHDENLNAIVEALTNDAVPAAAEVEALAALSDEELEERFSNLEAIPLVQRAGLMNLIARYRAENANKLHQHD